MEVQDFTPSLALRWVTDCVPLDPVGFVKSHGEFKEVFVSYEEVIQNRESISPLGHSRTNRAGEGE